LRGIEAVVKKRTGEPFVPAPEYAHGLSGFGVDLLVRDVARAVGFQTEVLGTEVVYADPDFAVLRHGGSEWMLHADHTFGDHPLLALTGDGALRGIGVELRLYQCDPDAAEARARARGHHVLAGSADKPHGLRECCLVDPDGYVWVPSRRI
jgi:catechol 2,3-dioxygenase-like lactoylglutathione lyase family enzyme